MLAVSLDRSRYPMLNDAQFKQVVSLAYVHWGLDIPDRKRTLVDNRISKLLANSQQENIEDLLEASVKTEDGMLKLFDVLSTNFTGFFREKDHFDCIEKEILIPAINGERGNGRKLRFWSAACSNGSEAYTLGTVIHDHLPHIGGWDVRILATDLSESALEEARKATYSRKVLHDIPADCLEKHFDVTPEAVTVKRHVRDLVTLGQVNLVGPWPMQGPFDAIFCRNVMIYFDTPTRDKLCNRLRSLLCEDGLLFIGSSESLVGQLNGLHIIRPGVYRKVPMTTSQRREAS
ncbi:MAG: chemotaxis protein methyltransferase CheR [Planctomycetota bacterium]|jgi:chemotaxis protein methyltransferase CheR